MWEYRYADPAAYNLNTLGREGWEAVGLMLTDKEQPLYVVLMKRKARDE